MPAGDGWQRRGDLSRKRLLIALLLLTGTACDPSETKVVFDEMWQPRWSTDPGEEYARFKEILEVSGHPVAVWKGDPIQKAQRYLNLASGNPADVDVLVLAMPQTFVNDPFINDWIETWVSQGGVLVLISDHAGFPQWVNPLAVDFGATFANVAPVVGDGVSHCPPGVSRCLAGSISYRPEHSGFWFGGAGSTHVTTHAGGYVKLTDPAPPNTALLRLWDAGFHPQGDPTHSVDGEPTLVALGHGHGAVFLAAEASMFGCGGATLGGMCAPDSEWNEEFIVNMFAWMPLYRTLAEVTRP